MATTSKSITPTEPQYRQFLDEVKTEIRQTKIHLVNKQHNFQKALPEHLAEQADHAM